jgi:hypothetical protein
MIAAQVVGFVKHGFHRVDVFRFCYFAALFRCTPAASINFVFQLVMRELYALAALALTLAFYAANRPDCV